MVAVHTIFSKREHYIDGSHASKFDGLISPQKAADEVKPCKLMPDTSSRERKALLTGGT